MFTFLDKDFFVSRKGKETGALVFLVTRFITFFWAHTCIGKPVEQN